MTNDKLTHIPDEVLALLVDEDPSPDQRDHMSACGQCSATLDSLIAQRRKLSQLSEIRSPDQWERIAFGVRDTHRSPSHFMRPVLSAIAAVMLIAFGWVMRSATEQRPSSLASVPTKVAITEPQANPTNRLAALETIVLATGAALARSPDDRLLKQMHDDAKQRRDSLTAQVQVVGDNARWY